MDRFSPCTDCAGRACDSSRGCELGHVTGELLKARTELAEALRLLRSAEWVFDDRRHEPHCPWCGFPKNMGHHDCELAAFLKRHEVSDE